MIYIFLSIFFDVYIFICVYTVRDGNNCNSDTEPPIKARQSFYHWSHPSPLIAFNLHTPSSLRPCACCASKHIRVSTCNLPLSLPALLWTPEYTPTMSDPIISEKERGSASSDASAPTPPGESVVPAEPEKKRKHEYKDFGHDQEKATRKCSANSFRNRVCFAWMYTSYWLWLSVWLLCRRKGGSGPGTSHSIHALGNRP